MSIFNRLSKEGIREYTHTGWYGGIVPVYLRDDGDEILFTERNGIPSVLIPIVTALWILATMFHPIPPYVYISGEIEKDHG